MVSHGSPSRHCVPRRTRQLVIHVPPSQLYDSYSPPGEIQPVLQGPEQTLSLPCLLQSSSLSRNDFWPLCSCSISDAALPGLAEAQPHRSLHLGHRYCHQTTSLNIPSRTTSVKLLAITRVHFSTIWDNVIPSHYKTQGQEWKPLCRQRRAVFLCFQIQTWFFSKRFLNNHTIPLFKWNVSSHYLFKNCSTILATLSKVCEWYVLSRIHGSKSRAQRRWKIYTGRSNHRGPHRIPFRLPSSSPHMKNLNSNQYLSKTSDGARCWVNVQILELMKSIKMFICGGLFTT